MNTVNTSLFLHQHEIDIDHLLCQSNYWIALCFHMAIQNLAKPNNTFCWHLVDKFLLTFSITVFFKSINKSFVTKALAPVSIRTIITIDSFQFNRNLHFIASFYLFIFLDVYIESNHNTCNKISSKISFPNIKTKFFVWQSRHSRRSLIPPYFECLSLEEMR